MSSRFRPAENRLSGIIGNTIGIPIEVEATIPKTPKQKVNNATSRPKVVSTSATSTPPGCTCGLSDKLAKSQSAEREARAKIERLSHTCEDLKKDILKAQEAGTEALQVAETKWKAKIDALEGRVKIEVKEKEDAIRQHSSYDEKIAHLTKQLEERNSNHSEDIERLLRRHLEELSAIKAEHNTQLAQRDERLNKLKSQIADKLTGNSSERQKQIDDLMKEMNKLQEEHEVLKAKLRAYGQTKNVQSVCDNCTTVNGKVKVLEERLKDRECLVSELKLMCDKFDRQLKQNDHLAAVSSDIARRKK